MMNSRLVRFLKLKNFLSSEDHSVLQRLFNRRSQDWVYPKLAELVDQIPLKIVRQDGLSGRTIFGTTYSAATHT